MHLLNGEWVLGIFHFKTMMDMDMVDMEMADMDMVDRRNAT